MNKQTSWREYLSEIIIDPSEKQRVAAIVGVSTMTLSRWARGISNPRIGSVRPLIDAFLPEHRARFISLLSQEYPLTLVDAEVQEINVPASEFYQQVFNFYATLSPVTRKKTINTFIFEQALQDLFKSNAGIELILAILTAPDNGTNQIRSLRCILGMSTDPFLPFQETKKIFLGMESLAVRSVLLNRSVIIHKKETLEMFYPNDPIRSIFTQSMATFPIQRANHLAGCMIVSSDEDSFFSPAHISLIEQYANLLVLAFPFDQFYEPVSFAFCEMPSAEVQYSAIAQWQNRVIQTLQGVHFASNRPSYEDAEEMVWKQIEDELLNRMG